MNASHEIAKGKRFAFGRNWLRFASKVEEAHIQHSIDDLVAMLEVANLQGRTFLDVGCGSGLSSLAARRLGATVYSFDFDGDCVACTRNLRERFAPGDQRWTIEQASVLDTTFMESLSAFDIVYSWGVLHHTGRMWEALQAAARPVAENGQLFVSIYNDQGPVSRLWRMIKRTYCGVPVPLKALLILGVGSVLETKSIVGGLAKHGPRRWIGARRNHKKRRGMSRWHDLVDWIGGYPFEVARPEEVFQFYRDQGFALQSLVTAGGQHGCNRFVFQRPVKSQLESSRNSKKHERHTQRAA